jgi:hypothetical protein
MTTEAKPSKPKLWIPAALFAIPFVGAILAHFLFAVTLPVLGGVALLCLVVGGWYYLFWRQIENGPDELVAIFMIGQGIGTGVLGMAFLHLFIG